MALAGLVMAFGGPTVALRLVDAWTADAAELRATRKALSDESARHACVVNRLQARVAVAERNLRLVTGFAVELNGAPPNDSFRSEIRVDRSLEEDATRKKIAARLKLGDGELWAVRAPVRFGAQLETPGEQEPCAEFNPEQP